ncbi:MAG TPA: glycosyltransferase family A protein [Gaiellaceae bacterium]|nr:glycosyltransferase family A protein [Gaiellaceae bacterium]
MTSAELPSFDLVVATVDRTAELDRLLSSLDRQTHRGFRVLVVDQNDDDRIADVVAAHDLDVLRLRSPRGLSRARNVALPHLAANVVAFPDDDCAYADEDLLERVGRRFLDHPDLDGLTGRAVGVAGSSSPSWETDNAILTDDNLWNRAISFTIFLRRGLLTEAGQFDEQLGLGSGTPWSSGEEIDLLIRAVRSGARISYDPQLTVRHEDATLEADELRALGYRDGASVGYLLRKHRYPARVRSRMLIRPLGGAVASLGRGDGARARFHLATLRGRVDGLRGRVK